MKILVACEESQTVTIELRKLGHDAYSCDLMPCSGGYPEWHIMCDVLLLLNGFCDFTTIDGKSHTVKGKWDMIIAFPPCTYMSKAGACRMFPRAGEISPDRFQMAMHAKKFFMELLSANCEKIAIENPTPLKCINLPKETQVIQPYYFGEPFSKRTCLWLRGLNPLKPTSICTNFKPFVASNTSCFSRGGSGSLGYAKNQKHRSKTFLGVAAAMAFQWAGCASPNYTKLS